MCISPVKVITPDGAQLVSCRECWQCRQRKIDDYVGRNIAESKTAKKAHAFTLTYGTDEDGSADHVRARILTYSDVQKFFKKVRAAGYPCRYFVVGEYGSTKGRAHWHGLIYWLDKVPDMAIRKERDFSLPWWEHGYSFVDDPSPAAIRYACKYIQKDMHKGGRQGMVAFSRFPPLGSEYFKQLAEAYAKAGKAPNTLDYSFPGVDRRNKQTGKVERVQFRIQGKSEQIFLEHFLNTWEALYGKRWVPPSEAVEAYQDKVAREHMERTRGPRIKPFNPEDPAEIRKGKAIKARIIWEDARLNPDYMDEIAEQNYILYSLMKAKERRK